MLLLSRPLTQRLYIHIFSLRGNLKDLETAWGGRRGMHMRIHMHKHTYIHLNMQTESMTGVWSWPAQSPDCRMPGLRVPGFLCRGFFWFVCWGFFFVVCPVSRVCQVFCAGVPGFLSVKNPYFQIHVPVTQILQDRMSFFQDWIAVFFRIRSPFLLESDVLFFRIGSLFSGSDVFFSKNRMYLFQDRMSVFFWIRSIFLLGSADFFEKLDVYFPGSADLWGRFILRPPFGSVYGVSKNLCSQFVRIWISRWYVRSGISWLKRGRICVSSTCIWKYEFFTKKNKKQKYGSYTKKTRKIHVFKKRKYGFITK